LVCGLYQRSAKQGQHQAMRQARGAGTVKVFPTQREPSETLKNAHRANGGRDLGV
jgi:hypothetical protein